MLSHERYHKTTGSCSQGANSAPSRETTHIPEASTTIQEVQGQLVERKRMWAIAHKTSGRTETATVAGEGVQLRGDLNWAWEGGREGGRREKVSR